MQYIALVILSLAACSLKIDWIDKNLENNKHLIKMNGENAEDS